MALPGLRGLTLRHVFVQAFMKFSADDMSTHAAALAYRTLFALFPFVIFLTALLGFINASQFFDWMRAQAAYFLPDQALTQVNQVLAELETPRGGLLSVGIALALWSASFGIMQTMTALNVAYEVKERRATLKRFLIALLYTMGLAAMLIVAAGLMILGPQALSWLAQFVGIDAYFIAAWAIARWPVAVFLMMLAVSLVYYAAPNVKLPFRLITPGSVIAVIVWIAASLGFGFYVQNFAKYNATYGSIGAVIVLLLYFFISAAVLLFGAEVNAVIERERGRIVENPS